jgi:hypothetical protein
MIIALFAVRIHLARLNRNISSNVYHPELYTVEVTGFLTNKYGSINEYEIKRYFEQFG